jgi:hypothetical protein
MSVSLSIRDERLLKLIMPGACTFKYLWEKAGAYFTSQESLRQRLSQLGQAEFIESRIYQSKENEKYALYVLGAAGVDFLSTERYYPTDQIRTMLPSAHTVPHELVVTDVVRCLLRESLRVPYFLRYYDDPVCRKHQKLLGLSGPTIPDLMVAIRHQWAGRPYRLMFEVHMGTVPVLNVIDKATKHKNWQIIYLCLNRDDIHNLKTAMQEHREKLKVGIYFATVYDFCTVPGGIFGTNYITLDDRRISLYQ